MDIPVECVSQDNRIHILESHSSLAVEQQRSELLLDLACSEGTFRLPISQRGLDLLQEAGKSIKHGKQWTERRFSDLGRVAEVSAFLCDDTTYKWSLSQLAKELEHLVQSDMLLDPDTKYNHQKQTEHECTGQCPLLQSTACKNQVQQCTVEQVEKLTAQPAYHEPRSQRYMLRSGSVHEGDLHSIAGVNTSKDTDNGINTADSCHQELVEQQPSVRSINPRLRKACQVLSELPKNVQMAIFALVQLPLSSLMHTLPSSLHGALFQRHFDPGHASLDISNQLHAFTVHGVQRSPLHMLASHLSSLRPLRHLNVSQNGLCAADVPLLATLVSTHASQLATLRLRSNFVCNQHMHNSRYSCPSMDMGACMSNRYAPNSHALQSILACIARCSGLTTLDLSSCQMSSSCMRMLGGTLHALPALQRLDLSDLVSDGSKGSFSTGSFRMLCAALPGLKHLSHLNLRNNSMAAHFQLLAKAVRHMHALHAIDIGGNTPDFHSLACFVAAATQAPRLHTLLLDGLAVSCSSDWFFTMQLLQQCAAAFFEVVGVATHSSSLNPIAAHQNLAESSGVATSQSDTHSPLAPETPRLSNLWNGSSGAPGVRRSISSMHGNDACIPANSKNSMHAPAPFKSLSLRNMTIDGLAVPSVLQIAVLNLAWNPNLGSGASAPELLEVTPTMHAHAWRLSDALQGLTLLDLSHTDFEGFWTSYQNNFIASLHSLQDLRLSRCNMPSTALTSLCTALAGVQHNGRYKGLTSLDWSENPVRAEAFRPLCSLTTLQSLCLRGCGLRKQQQMELCMHATSLVALIRLDIGFLKSEGVTSRAAPAA